MKNQKLLPLMFGLWLFVYPIVTAMLYLFRTCGTSLPLPIQTEIATLFLVPVMIGLVAPFVKKQIEQLSAKNQEVAVPSSTR